MQKLPRPALHFRRRPPRKRQQQDALRIGALQHQMRDAVGERVGLAGAGAGNDQQRTIVLAAASPVAVLHREPLLRVQRREEIFAAGGHRRARRKEWMFAGRPSESPGMGDEPLIERYVLCEDTMV